MSIAVTFDTRSIANAARIFANKNGRPVGVRGRLSVQAYSDYLVTQPATAREIAKALGMPVGVRGRVSRKMVETVAENIR